MMNILSAQEILINLGLDMILKNERNKNILRNNTDKIKLLGNDTTYVCEREGYWKDTELSWFIDFKFNRPKAYAYKIIKRVISKFK